ncbi:hypothetical protein K2X30_08080 [bacterium]|jgi:hypothetical protein|nr:hypothetical protein [bacterium]
MKRSSVVLVLGMTAMVLQPHPAQAANCYNGYGLIDINRRWVSPGRSPFCGTRHGASDPRAMQACLAGLDSALWMAEVLGRNNGDSIGLVMGYSYGMHTEFERWQNDARSRQEGAAKVQGWDYRLAKKQGGEAAISPATTQGESDAVKRFELAVQNQSEPVDTISTPNWNYAGVLNGWKQMGFRFKDENDLIDDATARLNSPRYRGIADATFDDLRDYSYRDLWKNRDLQGYGRYDWKNGEVAWNRWLKSRSPGVRDYNNLPALTEDYTDRVAKDAVDPKTGKPLLDDKGKPVQFFENVKKTRVVKEASYYKGLWEESFKKTYAYYVEYFFATAYSAAVNEGCSVGSDIGRSMGLAYAEQAAAYEAYNKKYQDDSIQGYSESFSANYESSFKSTFTEYFTNPKIQVNDLQFFGKVTDDINRPGEEIRAQFAITNLGGRGKQVAVSIQGPGVQESAPAMSFDIKRLSRQSLSTDYMAKIRSDLKVGDAAVVQIDVDGTKGYDRKSLIIHQLVEVQSIQFVHIEATRGRGQLQVVLSNPTNHASPVGVKATLSLQGINPIELAFDSIPAHGTKTLTASFEGMDPLKIIQSQLVTGDVVLVFDNTQLHSSRGNAGINKKAELPQYFQELVNKQATAVAGVEPEARLGEVKRAIYDAIAKETTSLDGDVWKEHPETTMLGELVKQYKLVGQSPDAVAAYKALASELWPLAKNVTTGILGLGGQRSAFRDKLKEINPELKSEGSSK